MIALNLDLLSVGVTVAGIGLLGFTVFFNNAKSATNRSFLVFSLITILWSIANYLQYQPSTPEIGLWTVRAITFLGCWHAFSFFILCRAFPEEETRMRDTVFIGLTIIVAITSLLTLSPWVFQNVTATSETGVVTQIQNGPLIPAFGMMVLFFIGAGIVTLARKAWGSTGEKRKQIALMGAGTLITFVCIVAFNLILPSVFDDPRFLPLSALFIFPFIACTAYAIFRYRLLGIKALATEIVAFFLSVATLVQVMFSQSATELLFHSSVFGLVLGFSILMVRSVIREVHQREVIETQAQELTVANAQQEGLLHFISHEIKGYLTKNEAAFDAIRSGDFGEVTPQLHDMSTSALADTRKGVATVMDILDASNMKKGTVSYKKASFDLSQSIQSVVNDLTSAAREKGILLSYKKPLEGACTFDGDQEKIERHVLRNIIDNSIKYTPSGSVMVSLEKTDAGYRFTVADTGVGISEEDKMRLFTEGGHGKDSIKVNVHSTGYGLFIAKQVTEAHGGKIWAESDGPGKGSRFLAELPMR